MLEKFENKINNTNDNTDSIMVENFVNVKNEVNVNITESDLKYTPKSEYINNAVVLSVDDLLVMSEVEKVELLMKLQKQNEEVKKDNEQFRQQNFILLCKVRKMENSGQGTVTSDQYVKE